MTPDLRAVFVFDRDGEMQVFPSLEQAADYMEAVDVNDGEYEALYTLDGWVIDVRADSRESQVEVVVTEKNDVEGLRRRVATHSRPGGASTPDDLRAVANEEFRAQWELRWPRWPSWLDRRACTARVRRTSDPATSLAPE